MNPLAIQLNGDAESNEVLQEILNRRRVSDGSEPGPSKEAKVPSSLHLVENSMDRLIQELLYLEIKTEKFRKSSYNPHPDQLPKLEEALSSSCLISLADKLAPMPNWPLKTLPPPSEEEFEQIRKGMRPGFPREPERKNWFFFDIMSSVEWAKTFSVLHKLNRKDQVILLKSVILHCFNATQAFFSYEHKSNTIIHPDGTVPTFHTSFFRDNNPFGNNFFKLAIDPFIRHKIDKKEYVLLKALMLCNATVDGLSADGQRILTAERNRYSAALFSYCMATHGMPNAPAHYAALLAIVDILHRQAKIQKDVHVFVQMRRVWAPVPLIEEIME